MNPLLLIALLLGGCAGEIGHRTEAGVLLVDTAPSDVRRVDGKLATVDQQRVDLKVQPADLPPATVDSWVGVDDIGKPCTLNSDCQHQLCATNTHTGVKFCTKVCDRCTATPCPTGSGCQNAGLSYICAPGYPNAPC
jgi:hypothetical protein